jgi:hypothetical protein
LAASLFRLASVLNETGAKPDALAAFEQAREIQEKLVKEQPDDTNIQRGLLSIYRHMGVLRGSEHVSLLGQDSVRDHLQITPEQVKQVDDLTERRRSAFFDFRAYRNKSREEMRQLFEQRARETKQELSKLLDAPQMQRLEQISLQLRGTQSFSSPEVADEINLTDAQIAAIKKIKEDAYREIRNAWHDRHRDEQSRKQSHEVFKQSRRTTNEKLLSVLTAEQLAAWRGMLGEPFNGELRFPDHRRFQSCFGNHKSGKSKHKRRHDDDDSTDRISEKQQPPDSHHKETSPQ